MELEIIRETKPTQTANPSDVPRGERRQKAQPVGFDKVHVDAGMSTPSRGCTAGAVARDDQGYYLGSSTLIIHGLHNPATLEAVACREALALS